MAEPPQFMTGTSHTVESDAASQTGVQWDAVQAGDAKVDEHAESGLMPPPGGSGWGKGTRVPTVIGKQLEMER
jgi:hypothetical protein